MVKKLHRAFSHDYKKLADVITTQAYISKIELPNNKPTHDKYLDIEAIWDTGATNSVITKQLAQKLGIKPIDKGCVRGVGGNMITNVYVVNIAFNTTTSPLYFPMIRVTEGIIGDYDALIGMDIIKRGDFCISNGSDKTAFSFCSPALEDKLCLLEKSKEVNKQK